VNENRLDYVRSSMVFNMKMAYQNFSALCFFLLFQFLHDISLGYATITLLKLLVIGHFTHNIAHRCHFVVLNILLIDIFFGPH